MTSPAVYSLLSTLWTGSHALAMPLMFERPQVYQKALDFADQLAALTQSFPKGSYVLTDQLNRTVLLRVPPVGRSARQLHAGQVRPALRRTDLVSLHSETMAVGT